MTKDDREKPDGPHRAITPPERSFSAEVSRGVAKGTLGAVPIVGSMLSELAGTLLPDATAIEREHWEKNVSHGVNAAHDRLDELEGTSTQEETVGGLAAQVAKLLIEQCPDGHHREWVDAPSLAAELGSDAASVLDAIGELQVYGLVETRKLIGAPDRVRLTAGAYTQLDHQIMGWNTMDDARHVAGLVLEMGQSARTADLHRSTGWEKRRFNPAFSIVLGFVHDGPISAENQPDYPTRFFYLSPADRARLRRFLNRSS